MDLGVVHISQRLNIFVPIIFMFGNIIAESRNDGFVASLGLVVGLRMISGYCFVVDSKDRADGIPEFGYESRTIIGQN